MLPLQLHLSMCTQVYDASLQRDRDAEAEAEEGDGGRASFRDGPLRCGLRGAPAVAAPIKTVEKLPTPPSPGKPLRLEAGRELKAAGKALKWALKQQSAAEETYRCERAIYRAKCAQLEKNKMTGTAAQRMSAAYDLLDAVSKAERR